MRDETAQAVKDEDFKRSTAVKRNTLSIMSIADGFIWVPALFAQLVKYLGIFGLVILAVLLGVAMFFYTKNTQAWEVAVGAPEEVVAAPAAEIAGRAMSFGPAAEIEHYMKGILASLQHGNLS